MTRKTAIDLFAGLGGNSEGARMVGVEVTWAANHCPVAVETHAANHPSAAHACQDLHQADFTDAPSHDILLASPCCQGHSNARGGDGPQHDDSRSTAWAVVTAAEVHRPAHFMVENVPEFLRWSLFPAWRMAMESLGYNLTTEILDAADLGVPQHRERMFIVGSQGDPVVIPKGNQAHASARSIIDWDADGWVPTSDAARAAHGLKPFAAATKDRLDSGRERFGDRFVAPYYGSGSGKTGRDIERPIGTIGTVDGWRVNDGDRSRMLNVDEYRRAMAFPESYKLATTKRDAVRQLGNAVPPPMTAHVVQAILNS